MVPDNSYLVNKVSVHCKNKNINLDELETYIKQKPNKKILDIFRFHLGMYNLLSGKKERKWKEKFKTVMGEPPVIYDAILTQKTNRQFLQYLRNKGYYAATVYDTVYFKNKKANIHYIINTGNPYTISAISYQCYDEKLITELYNDTSNSLLKKGILFDIDILQAERERIVNYFKKNGYYEFNADDILFIADTSQGKQQTALTININKLKITSEDGTITEKNHEKYKINNIYVYANFDPRSALQNPQEYYNNFDTLLYKEVYFIYNTSLKINPNLLLRNIYIKRNEFYNLEQVLHTHQQLTTLKLYKLVNIRFNEEKTDTSLHLINCMIQLTPFTFQSYSVELEGTNSSGNYGIASSIIYQHRNIFHGAELLTTKFKGALQMQSAVISEKKKSDNAYIPFNTYEIGAESGLQIPGLLLPIKTETITKRYNPQTIFLASYNFQIRRDYTRTLTNISFGYQWKGVKYIQHRLNLIENNFVKVLNPSDEFLLWLQNAYFKSSYTNHFISGMSYTLTFNNQNYKKRRDFSYLKWSLEPTGNMLTLYNKTFKKPKEDGAYKLFDTRYAQYIKSDIDYRYYDIWNPSNSVVYRLFFGFAHPYGNLNIIPFEKQYFAGGANSIRAWSVRSLGPGAYHDTLSIPNQTADMKIEANIEFRFDLFWVLEGALFFDAGNIWAINAHDNRNGSMFKWNSFYKQIALGTGLGTRFDFSFFILRFDFGMKLREPDALPNKRLIIGTRKIQKNDFTINVGIGYPF